MKGDPTPKVGQWWRFGREEGVVKRILPGGGGDMGIAEFEGLIPTAHVSTMLWFDSWKYIGKPPKPMLPPPCTCIALEGGVIISDGCAAHAGADAVTAAEAPRKDRLLS